MAEFVYFARTGRDLRARPAESKNASEGSAPRRSYRYIQFQLGWFQASLLDLPQLRLFAPWGATPLTKSYNASLITCSFRTFVGGSYKGIITQDCPVVKCFFGARGEARTPDP